ncbi:hypothetical protein FA95DRAFT_1614289 [Auriscalpium vulgare]|uniref:Uncharacterized protein n=1 Tax=Auriscalpium vulgare TaxID=40419 RepID=A0ACB8QZV0_9AGAM|nr:hypothetical protein FA95DRAFT_1614289 [Auriscalpium vulgare]
MSFFAPYPVTSHALSSSSLPQPVADLVSELKMAESPFLFVQQRPASSADWTWPQFVSPT